MIGSHVAPTLGAGAKKVGKKAWKVGSTALGAGFAGLAANDIAQALGYDIFGNDTQEGQASSFMRSGQVADDIDLDAAYGREQNTSQYIDFLAAAERGGAYGRSIMGTRDALTAQDMMQQNAMLQQIAVPLPPPSLDEIMAIMTMDL
jgi:hypothetical protein